MLPNHLKGVKSVFSIRSYVKIIVAQVCCPPAPPQSKRAPLRGTPFGRRQSDPWESTKDTRKNRVQTGSGSAAPRRRDLTEMCNNLLGVSPACAPQGYPALAGTACRWAVAKYINERDG